MAGTTVEKLSLDIGADVSGLRAGFAEADNLVDGSAKKIQNWAKLGTVAAGAFAVAMGGLAVNAAADFQQQLSGIQAVSGATSDQMKLVSASALQIGADSVFSASEAAGAYEELIKAGVSVKDALGGAAAATVSLAAASGVDMTEAATIASNAMNQFSLSGGDMSHVADVIAGAANASAIDVNQFGYSLSQVGAVAHLAGLSFDDTSTAIAVMGQAGIVGSDAGTSLKTMLNNLVPSTKQATAEFKKLGLITADGSNQFFDAKGNLKDLADVSGTLQKALRGQTKEQKLATLQILFGSDAMRGAAVFADQGAAGVNAMAAAMSKVTAADVAATRMNNFKGSIEQFKGSLDTLAITVGTPLLGPLRSFVDVLTALVNSVVTNFPAIQAQFVAVYTAIKPWAPVIEGAAVAIGSFAAVIGGLLVANAVAASINDTVDAINKLPEAAKNSDIVKLFNRMRDSAQEAYLRVLYMKDALGNLKDKTVKLVLDGADKAKQTVDDITNQMNNLKDRTVKIAIETQSKAGAAGGAASGIIGGITGGIAAQAKTIAPAIISAITGALGIVVGFVGWPVILGGLAVIAIAGLAIKFHDQIFEFVKKIPGWLADGFQAVGDFFRTTFPHLIGEAIGFAFAGLLTIFLVWPIQAAGKIISAIPTIVSAIGSFMASIATTVGNAIVGVVQFFIELPGKIVSALASFGSMVATAFTAGFNFLAGIVTSGIEAIIGFFASLPDRIVAFINYVRERGIYVFVDLFNKVGEIISGAADFLGGLISTVVNTIIGFVSTLPARVGAFFQSAVDWAKGVLNGLVSFITSIPLVQNILTILNNVVQGFKDGWNRVNDATGGALNGLIDTVKGIPGKILGALGNLGTMLYDAGSKIIQGLVNGITDSVSKVGDAMKKVSGKIAGFLPGSPVKEGPLSGKHEPFLLGQSVGNQIAQGLASVTPTVGMASGGFADRVGSAGINSYVSNSSSSGNTIQVAPGAVQFGNIPDSTDQATLESIIQSGFEMLVEEIGSR